MPNGSSVLAITTRDLIETLSTLKPLNKVFVQYSPNSVSPNTGYSSPYVPANDIEKKAYPIQIGFVVPSNKVDTTFLYVETELAKIIHSPDMAEFNIRIYDSDFGYKAFVITDVDIDTSSPFSKVELVTTDISLTAVKLCVKYQLFNTLYKPYTSISAAPYKLPYVQDEDGNYLTIFKSSIASNYRYVQSVPHGDVEYNYIYVVAQVPVNNKSQLFLFGLKIYSCMYDGAGGHSIPVVIPATEVSGWIQLTNMGDNRNPDIVVDAYNNLHVFWESDREGSNLYQIYYGVLGPSEILSGSAAIMSILDKKADLDRNGTSSFDFMKSPLLLPFVDPYLDSYAAASLESKTKNNGAVSIVDYNEIRISGNVIEDQAMAFLSLSHDDMGQNFSNDFDQVGFELAFTLKIEQIFGQILPVRHKEL